MTTIAITDLKQRMLRGGVAKLFGQGLNFVLRVVYMMVLARLLTPADFGLVAMVTVITGIYGMFTTAGLSSATVQRADISDEQISTLFWINVAIGAAFAVLCAATAPALAAFYNEPQLLQITFALAAGFLFTGAGVQHYALLQRHLRYVAITAIDATAQVLSSLIGIGLALAGFGYWSLVAATIALPAITTAGSWFAIRWVPSRPRWSVDIRSMLHFGTTVTANNLIVYVGYNLEKVLLGRFWGPDVLGLYGRAYQLVSMPTDYLNGAIGSVAFSALSRLQHDPATLKNYFLKGYSLVLSMTLPIAMFCGLFANEIILIVFGPKWAEAAAIFRLLTPTVLVFSVINPLAWLLLSTGLQGRSLRIGLVLAPIVMISYCIGLPYGPTGVALSYSTAMVLWVVPHIWWCLKGTGISMGGLFRVLREPLLSGFAGALGALLFQLALGAALGPYARLVLGGLIMCGLYFLVLLLGFGQKSLYWDLVKLAKNASGRHPLDGKMLVPENP
jgi:PST family polysaccharide transporter